MRQLCIFMVGMWRVNHRGVFFLECHDAPLDFPEVCVECVEVRHFGMDLEGPGDCVSDVGRCGQVGEVEGLVFAEEVGGTGSAPDMVSELTHLGVVGVEELVLEN